MNVIQIIYNHICVSLAIDCRMLVLKSIKSQAYRFMRPEANSNYILRTTQLRFFSSSIYPWFLIPQLITIVAKDRLVVENNNIAILYCDTRNRDEGPGERSY